MRGKNGQVTFYIIFIFMAFILITIGALVGPVGAAFSTEMYLAGETILLNTEDDINSIQDPVIRASVQEVLTDAKNSAANNIEVSLNLFQYSWIFILLMTLIVIFVLTRMSVETGQIT